MTRLAFLADEHVPRAYVRALRASGFDVQRAGDDCPGGIDDDSLLDVAEERGLVLVTNDRDFVVLARQRSHAGIVIYTDQGVAAGDFVGGIRRIDTHLPGAVIEDEVLWLDQWVE